MRGWPSTGSELVAPGRRHRPSVGPVAARVPPPGAPAPMPASGIWPAVLSEEDPPTVPFPASSGPALGGPGLLESGWAAPSTSGPTRGAATGPGAVAVPGSGATAGPGVAGPGVVGPGVPRATWGAPGRRMPGGSAPEMPWPVAGLTGAGRSGQTDDVDGRGPANLPSPGGDAGAARSRGRSVLAAVVPAAWRGTRLDPGRRGATALAVVAALAAVVAAVGVWMDRPRVEPVAALPAVVVPADPTAVPEPAASPTGVPAVLVVSVSGRVARPGLVEVPDGARVADVLEAAGGALPDTDLSLLNLARRVADGEQIAVGVPPAPDAGGAPAAAPGSGVAAPDGGAVDLNTATLEQLDALAGVGPVTAQRILDWRATNGRFTLVEQLREVEGIGERRFAQLRELVVVR